jgi:hypothetical protein
MLLRFEGGEIAAAHADFRDGIFERAVHRQVAHRDAAVRDFEVGDPVRRTRRRASRGVGRRDFCRRGGGCFRSGIRCRRDGNGGRRSGFCRRGFHQSGEIITFGRHFEQRRESRNVDAVEDEAHFAQIALGEFYAQRIDARHGPLLPVAQGEARQRSRTLGRERKQMLRIAAQAAVGRQAAVHGRDVERLPEIGQRARQCEILQPDSDVEFRAFDVVAHVGRERTALGEVEHGPDVGFLAGEIDARNMQVQVVHAPLGIEREVLVKDPAVADRDVVNPDFPRLRGFFGRCGDGCRVAREAGCDVIETEGVAPLVDLHVGTCERDFFHEHTVSQQRP